MPHDLPTKGKKSFNDFYYNDLYEKGLVSDVGKPLWQTRHTIVAKHIAHQKTRGGSRNLILISDMSFLVNFRLKKPFGRSHKNNEGYSDSRVDHSLTPCYIARYRQTVGFCTDAHVGPL
jgi:hypothetical protein